ncbi:MAG: hypothetical protein HGB34_03110 [Candidatus Moranbacteria bacterium]|nr:hypothetical protein [Candidatus Moranbacteria bacterium]NTW75866.1 hypothetical protein [Candidatus Moranbacteria bacterium]
MRLKSFPVSIILTFLFSWSILVPVNLFVRWIGPASPGRRIHISESLSDRYYYLIATLAGWNNGMSCFTSDAVPLATSRVLGTATAAQIPAETMNPSTVEKQAVPTVDSARTPVIKPEKPVTISRPAIQAPMPKSYRVVDGKMVCAKKHDKPGKSKKNKKKHMDMECCLDPDETPNPHCYYPPEKYGKYLK